LAGGILHQPVTVSVTPAATTVEKIDQSVFFVERPLKIGLLTHLLKEPEVSRALVFTRTKHGADKVVRKLCSASIPAVAIHGNKSQNYRERALEDFKQGRSRVLVATDIASRGLDIDQVSHVVNFDLPNEPESYVHRIGRTGRAGASGIAIAFCATDERPLLNTIERLTRKRLDVQETPKIKFVRPQAPRPGNSGQNTQAPKSNYQGQKSNYRGQNSNYRGAKSNSQGATPTYRSRHRAGGR
jgi:ATP-dependent RNA helicase RhlE